MLKIYLDNCCYNRPFDEQANTIVKMETRAKLFIQSLIKYGDIHLVYSFVLLSEIYANPSIYKKESILDFIKANAAEYIGAERRTEAQPLAAEIAQTGIKPFDAAHIACAVISQSDCFVTTDKRLLKYKTDRIKLVNPIEFVNLWEGNL
jgi:predicted nucleic acid-binding protein